MKIGVCIRAKDEQKIIVDWVRYYQAQGFDKIIIYDNVSTPSIKDTLGDCMDRVEINIDTVMVNTNQDVVYQDCIDRNKDLDWLLLCDADEFIWHRDKNIKQFLSEFSEDTCSILLNWLVYGTSGLEKYDRSKTVFEQFTHRESYSHFWNIFVKSFIRPRLIDKLGNIHITSNPMYKMKNVYHQEIPYISEPLRCDHPDLMLSSQTPMLLVHYMTLDNESMLEKHHRNKKGVLIEMDSNKYTDDWYRSEQYGFKDNYKDWRMKPNENRIYFVIKCQENHKSIINTGSGASEFLFLMTASHLSRHRPVTICYHGPTIHIDGVDYVNVDHTMNLSIYHSIIVVQRHFDQLIDLHKRNPTNRYILWSHDYLEHTFSHLSGNYTATEISDYFHSHRIITVAVSEFHKQNLLSKMPELSVSVIYNALFSDIYKRQEVSSINKNQIVFASNWGKGLERILKIGSEWYKKNKDSCIVLLKPSYCDMNPDFTSYPFVKMIGTVTDKDEYCRLLQSSLCVLTSSYPETFGCIFAEALHLGVPVIGDRTVRAGFTEIISPSYLCNFNHPLDVIQKIKILQLGQHTITLDKKFYEEDVLMKWNTLFELIMASQK